MFRGSEAPGGRGSEGRAAQRGAGVGEPALPSPVALAYTTLARGSWLCRSSTALPILVELAFLALWHSSNTIWPGVKGHSGKREDCRGPGGPGGALSLPA